MAPTKRTRQMDFYVYVDTVVFTINPDRSIDPKDRLEVLVMQRPERKPNKWALPGGLVGDDERLEDTAIRKVREETGIVVKEKDLHQVGAYGSPGRDDRFRAIAIAYMALMPHPGDIKPTKDSDKAEFIPYRRLRDKRMLEFDHSDIIYGARKEARKMLEDTKVALSFCRSKFTISELRGVYEAFLQYEVDAANFRRKIDLTEGFVTPTDEFADFGSSPGRPAKLYKAATPHVSGLASLSTPIRFRRSNEPRR